MKADWSIGGTKNAPNWSDSRLFLWLCHQRIEAGGDINDCIGLDDRTGLFATFVLRANLYETLLFGTI